ncbi:hypothetical protein KAR91_48045 [Candidatus Pacearchaeota archaeon]|nr:hypothetical protein [Candidatus Pacearchaeota archaeon]
MNNLTQKRLMEVMHYNKYTGVFTWISADKYNKRKIGKEAGRINNDGYRGIRIDKIEYGAYRLAFLYMEGEWPDICDHDDGNTLNNKWLNLNNTDSEGNNKNMKKMKSNSSGIVRVIWHKNHEKWSSSISINKKLKQLYWGNCKLGAAICRFIAEKELGYSGRRT